MQETNGYVHINEASKVYNKTRQTFYNYISRNLIRTKKHHNKLFLHRGDIEQLLSNYVDEETITATPSVPTLESRPPMEPIPVTIVSENTDVPSYERLDDLKQELFMDNRNHLFALQQTIAKSAIELAEIAQALQKKQADREQYAFVSLKKWLFTVAYLGFIIVNIIIFSHLP